MLQGKVLPSMNPKHPWLIVVGKRLRRKREELDLTQAELAFHAGLDRSYVGGVERGERNISTVNLIQLALALDCNPPDLLPNLDTIKELDT